MNVQKCTGTKALRILPHAIIPHAGIAKEHGLEAFIWPCIGADDGHVVFRLRFANEDRRTGVLIQEVSSSSIPADFFTPGQDPELWSLLESAQDRARDSRLESEILTRLAGSDTATVIFKITDKVPFACVVGLRSGGKPLPTLGFKLDLGKMNGLLRMSTLNKAA